MIRMPKDPFRGPLPPLTPEQRALVEELRTHVQELAGRIGERNLFRYPQLVEAAKYLRTTFAAFGYEVKRQPYDAEGQEAENIWVELPGSRSPEDIVVIGAHYDSVKGSPGADDNASGVAALLALARRFAKGKSARTLRFVAFTNEEPPFFQGRSMGSRIYARHCRAQNERIVLMLSLEMLGYYSDQSGSQRYPFPFGLFYPSTANFIAFVGNMENSKWVEQLLTEFRRQPDFPSEGGALWEWIPGVAWSDHWSFWREGYPAVMVTDTAHNRYPFYHTASDRPDKIGYDGFARVVSGLYRVVGSLVQSST
jgi:Zn-dependent M28 family amino/carboxypeptidase